VTWLVLLADQNTSNSTPAHPADATI